MTQLKKIFLLSSILVLLFSCRDSSPFQQQLLDLKAEITLLEEKDKELEKEYEAAAKMKKPAIERKITANQKKIDKL